MPEELSYGQVQVKVLVSGICGAQLAEIRGEKGNAAYLPHLLGHEGCGIVKACGVGVTRVKPGDKVVIHWRKGRIKLEVGLARGKKQHDKRTADKDRDWARQKERILKH